MDRNDRNDRNDQEGSSRRRFLQQLSVGAGAAGLGLFSPWAWAAPETTSRTKAPLASTAAPKEVIVIGAGLAGLAAAWELDEAGHEVTVLTGAVRGAWAAQLADRSDTETIALTIEQMEKVHPKSWTGSNKTPLFDLVVTSEYNNR